MQIAKQKNLALSPPITRESLLWLFAIQVVVLVPNFFAVAGWIPLVWVAVIFWRWKIFQGAWNYPSKLAKTLVVFICAAGLLLSLGVKFSLESMLSLLLVGAVLKLLEIKTRKDFVLLLFLSLFILAVQFIFFNHFLAALYGFLCLLLFFSALLQLYQTLPAKNLWQRLRPTALILLQAIPVMVLMFVVMPRLGAFWSVPAPLTGKTGMSDSMSPGDFNKLIESNELAFRVFFSRDDLPPNSSLENLPLQSPPPQETLYWRSLVFSHFDGRRWSPMKSARFDVQVAPQGSLAWQEKMDYKGDSLSYEIIAEPSSNTWLYSLDAPRQWSDGLLLSRELALQSRSPINQRISYRVTSALSYSDANLQTESILQNNLALPSGSNPETQRVAKAWMAEVGTREKLIEKLFSYYRSNFYYTLTPPALGKDSIDQFLWQSRQGFCEHFASSFVFFMRAAGIPARVVVGYQGGEFNTTSHYLTVYQRDAHAWAEVWTQDHGWRRYDPTAAVAPERIRRGLSESLSAQDRDYLASSYLFSSTIFDGIRSRWDALNFQWARWVMNYNSDRQLQVLTRLLQQVTPWRLVVFILGVLLVSGLLILAILFGFAGRIALPPEERAARQVYRQFCKKLKAGGFAPSVGETIADFSARVMVTRPDLSPDLIAISKMYEQLVYAENRAVLPQLKQQLSHFSVSKTKLPISSL